MPSCRSTGRRHHPEQDNIVGRKIVQIESLFFYLLRSPQKTGRHLVVTHKSVPVLLLSLGFRVVADIVFAFACSTMSSSLMVFLLWKHVGLRATALGFVLISLHHGLLNRRKKIVGITCLDFYVPVDFVISPPQSGHLSMFPTPSSSWNIMSNLHINHNLVQADLPVLPVNQNVVFRVLFNVLIVVFIFSSTSHSPSSSPSSWSQFRVGKNIMICMQK